MQFWGLPNLHWVREYFSTSCFYTLKCGMFVNLLYYLIKQTSNHLIAHYWQKGKIWNTGRGNKLTFIINVCPSGYLNIHAELCLLESDSHLTVSCDQALPGDPPPAHGAARSPSSHPRCWAGSVSLPLWGSHPFFSVWEHAEFGWGASW